jgi:hypothetical protein
LIPKEEKVLKEFWKRKKLNDNSESTIFEIFIEEDLEEISELSCSKEFEKRRNYLFTRKEAQ